MILCGIIQQQKKLDGFNESLQNGLAYQAFSESRLDQLETKPLNRCTYKNNNDPTFTWIINQKEQRNLIDSGLLIESSPFWLKGYMMVFQLTCEETGNKKSYSLYLFVENMKEKPERGHVEISWRAKSTLFTKQNISCMKGAYGTYSSSSEGFGAVGLEINIASPELKTLPQTVDVWVDIK